MKPSIYVIFYIAYSLNNTIQTQIESIQTTEVTGEKNTSFLNKSVAYASDQVKSIPKTDIISIYSGSLKIGEAWQDWALDQVFSEHDKTFDLFDVRHKVQLKGFNNSWPYYLKVSHVLPLSPDELDEWDPHDDSSNPYNVEIAYPWGVAFGFNMNGEPKVDATGNIDTDYAQWTVSKPVTAADDMNGDAFRPVISWKSTGTYATMDIRIEAKFAHFVGGKYLFIWNRD
ncbi:hypothetical protein ACFVR2_22905 [Gottfriedia sp. NPDC057991]|uniref:hypothetical protein n=1 Tax=Gottfriedia sp. NPDC057991 TaxID=3346298 RepID=UPI0036DF1628